VAKAGRRRSAGSNHRGYLSARKVRRIPPLAASELIRLYQLALTPTYTLRSPMARLVLRNTVGSFEELDQYDPGDEPA
jgi:hypothetical protein